MNDLLLHTEYVSKNKRATQQKNNLRDIIAHSHDTAGTFLKKPTLLLRVNTSSFTDISSSVRFIKTTEKMFKTRFAFICNSISCYIVFFLLINYILLFKSFQLLKANFTETHDYFGYRLGNKWLEIENVSFLYLNNEIICLYLKTILKLWKN